MDIVPGLVRAQIKDLRGITAFPVDALRTFLHPSTGSSVGGKTDGDRLWVDGDQAGDRDRERSAVETKDVETADMFQPDQVASAAVTTNGNLTMVNTYLAEQDAAGISSAESSDSQSDAGSTDNNVGSSDNNEQDSSTSDTEE